MSLRFLLGPVSTEFAAEYLEPLRRTGACVAFSWQPGADVQLASDMD
jgi:hypothetical protein